MKIGVLHIIRAHMRTLCDAETNRISIFDLFLFYVLPLAIGFSSIYLGYSINRDFDNLSITFFGIFIALLLNIQVAMFAVFQRNWTVKNDTLLDEIQTEKINQRKEILSELNTNISYMITICALVLVFFIVIYAMDEKDEAIDTIVVTFYAHFLLTLLMIVKRTHALFQAEYDLEVI